MATVPKKSSTKHLNPDRNETIDIFRGIAIVWVVFVHCFYWSGLSDGKSIWFSWLLLEMPLLFFVTGAAVFHSKKNYISFICSRLKGLLIPFWFYSIISISLIFITRDHNNLLPETREWWYWLFPFKAPVSVIRFVSWHLWFLPIYLYMMPLLPAIKTIAQKAKGAWVIALPAFSALILFLFKPEHSASPYPNIKNLGFYLLAFACFIYLGSLYSKGVFKQISRRSFIFVLAGIFLLLLISAFFSSFNMQANKFPPNLGYLFLGFFWILLVVYFEKPILNICQGNVLLNRALLFVSKKSLTFYLYQAVSFLLVNLTVIHRLPTFLIRQPVSIFLIYLVLVLPLTYLFTVIFSFAERIGGR